MRTLRRLRVFFSIALREYHNGRIGIVAAWQIARIIG